jgi:cyclase
MSRKPWRYSKGLHCVGNGVYAYLQPDGGWGWSNAGLIEHGGESLLVDTLFDEHLTAGMLADIRQMTGLGAHDIGTVVNTHANGDHTHGNALLDRATIIASQASAMEMAEITPQMLASMMRSTPQMGATGNYLARIFGQFDFEAVRGRVPTRTFEGQLALQVGDLEVRLEEVGPAHTAGDVIVHVPARGLLFTGDILFIDSTPIIWSGPVSNWIRACDRILQLDADVIVPGHGPITDEAGVKAVRDYLGYIDREARRRFEAGLDVFEAALDIALNDYDSWGDAERIAANVDALYCEYRGGAPVDAPRRFELMARIDKERQSRERGVAGDKC